MLLRLLAALLLLCVGVSLFAQSVTEIETRGIQPTSPDYPVTGGGQGNRGADTDLLEVTLDLPDGPRLPIGQPYDYEVTVTNKSKKVISLPRSIEWSDLADGHPTELKYDEMEINFIFSSREQGNTYLGSNLMLYGRASKPSTMVALQPGDAMRLRGRVELTAPWLPIPANAVVPVHLRAALVVGSCWLHPAPDPVNPGAYLNDRKEVYFIPSQSMLPVELTTKEALPFPPKPKAPARPE